MCNSRERLATRENVLSNSRERIAIRENELSNSRERIAIRENGLSYSKLKSLCKNDDIFNLSYNECKESFDPLVMKKVISTTTQI